MTVSTISIPGQRGFGVGVCNEDEEKLLAMGLSKFENTDNNESDDYGNYLHTSGSVLVWIPAFCYRIGNKNHKLYPVYGDNLIEIADADMKDTDGFILHRAFVDGGKVKSGFFVDKYLSSKDQFNKEPISVKYGDPISLYYDHSNNSTKYNASVDMISDEDNGILWGHIQDAIVLSKRRGPHYVCLSCFAWSAIAMLSLAHAQHSDTAKYNAWYDDDDQINFPKGNTSDGTLHDFRDHGVSFEPSKFNKQHSLTGSGQPFNKTTHNGQNNGVADVSGNFMQPTIGVGYSLANQEFRILKPTASIYDFVPNRVASTDDVCNDDEVWEPMPWDISTLEIYDHDDVERQKYKNTIVFRVGTKDNDCVFFKNNQGSEWSCCGVFPPQNAYRITESHSESDEDNCALMFGTNAIKVCSSRDAMMYVGGYYYNSSRGGIWLRYISDKWTVPYQHCSMRVMGYID